MTKESSPLETLRAALNGVDRAIVEALAERDRIISEITRVKTDATARLRDRTREQEILERLANLAAEHGVNPDYVTRLYHEILDHSVRSQEKGITAVVDAEQRPVTVAYQGTEGSYSHQTAARHFSTRKGPTAFHGLHTFKNVLDAVRSGSADYGVLPIENTTAGSINQSYDLIASSELHIVGEDVQPIDHCVIAIEPVPLSSIKRIYSQAQALAQCTRFLDGLSGCDAVSWTDTAMSCTKIIEDGDPTQAAIASEAAARRYHLHVIARDIADQPENFTRFWVIAKEPVVYDPRVPCKTSLVMAVRHEDGALLEALRVFADHGYSLCKLESRPRPRTPFQYLFYVDVEGNLADPELVTAIDELKAHTELIKVLGSYPARTTKAARPTPRPRGKRKAAATGGGEHEGTSGAEHGRESPGGASLSAETRALLESKPYRLVSRLTRRAPSTVHAADTPIGGARRVLIAGPAAVRSDEQLYEAAVTAKEAGADLLRAGCFLTPAGPRDFQGLGWEGVEILARVGRELGLPTVTRVLSPEQAARAAEQVDVLEVGAADMRNTELLKELGRVDRPVLLTRGLDASVDEWLCAAEYVAAEGNSQVVLCEAGIRGPGEDGRRVLDPGAFALIAELSHLPVLAHPGAAGGGAAAVSVAARATVAAGARGLLLDWSDEADEQQIRELAALLRH